MDAARQFDVLAAERALDEGQIERAVVFADALLIARLVAILRMACFGITESASVGFITLSFLIFVFLAAWLLLCVAQREQLSILLIASCMSIGALLD